MRLSKTIDFGEGKHVILKEATVSQVRNILKEFKENGKYMNMPIIEMLTEHTLEIIGLFGDCITLYNCTWDDLTYSEIMQIWEGAKGLLPFLSNIEKVIRQIIDAYPTMLLSNILKVT